MSALARPDPQVLRDRGDVTDPVTTRLVFELGPRCQGRAVCACLWSRLCVSVRARPPVMDDPARLAG